jgi:hypothetical protein
VRLLALKCIDAGQGCDRRDAFAAGRPGWAEMRRWQRTAKPDMLMSRTPA